MQVHPFHLLAQRLDIVRQSDLLRKENTPAGQPGLHLPQADLPLLVPPEIPLPPVLLPRPSLPNHRTPQKERRDKDRTNVSKVSEYESEHAWRGAGSTV